MTISRVSMLLGAALVLGNAAGVQAADLYGGQGGGSIKDGYVAPVCCARPGWYFRIDGGYSMHGKPKIDAEGALLTDEKWENTGFIGGGVGTYLGRNLRADFTYDHGFESNLTGTAGENIVGAGNPPIHAKAPMSRDLVLFNLYYDIDTGSRFTPYIGGGVGLVRHSIGTGVLTQTIAPGVTNFGVVDPQNSTHFAAAAMAGFSVALGGGGGGCGSVGGGAGSMGCGPTSGMLLDIGYRFVYEGKAKTGDTYYAGIAGDPIASDLISHEIRAGVRYNLN